MVALGQIQEYAAQLVVPLICGALIVADDDEQIRLTFLAMVGIDLVSDLSDGAVLFYTRSEF